MLRLKNHFCDGKTTITIKKPHKVKNGKEIEKPLKNKNPEQNVLG